MKVMLSIKPEFASKILDGSKRFEYRRRVFSRGDVDTLVIYVTSPVSKVVAEVEILEVIEDSPEEIWNSTESYSGIDRLRFDTYFNTSMTGFAISLGKVYKLEMPLPLNSYYPKLKRPPQSFVYIK